MIHSCIFNTESKKNRVFVEGKIELYIIFTIFYNKCVRI